MQKKKKGLGLGLPGMVQPASVSALPFTAFPGPVSELLRALFSYPQITVSSLVGMETRLINASPAAQSMDKLTSHQCPVPYLGRKPFWASMGKLLAMSPRSRAFSHHS